MSESKDAKKIKTIAFRLTDEEYALAESAATAAGDESPSSWCRTLVLQQAIPGYRMTKNQRLLYEEIVPTLEGRVDGPKEFARQTLERFRNPFLQHKLADISLHHATKVQVRLVPTFQEFLAKFGRVPPLLHEVLNAPPLA